ncbi:hypothetical protein [Leisingera sp. NJS204]|uniref:hypothetical protein n=1 Tax=Leisingera sp. NJS204 TaxID=2508307 RepID=UPI001011C812|nr:hypothetical protein [Leisingera sp. NJS204]QAX31300.1 hypothetical protein ETW24_19015 [Leisingera sp. NJS204]
MSVSASRIVAEIERDPGRMGREIVAACGCSVGHISRIASQQNLIFGTRYLRSKTRAEAVPLSQLADENASWLRRRGAELGVSLTELVNACVTDARLDEEETQ